MQYLFFAILIICLITSILMSLPAWGVSLIVVYLGAYFIVICDIANLCRSTPPIKVNIRKTGDQISYSIDEDIIRERSAIFPFILLPIAISCAWSIYIMEKIKPDNQDMFFWYIGYPIWIIVLAFASIFAYEWASDKTVKKIRNKLDSIIESLNVIFFELLKTQEEINQVSQKVGIMFDCQRYQLSEELNQYDLHSIFKDDEIRKIIANKVDEATSDLKMLEHAHKHYSEIIQKYREVSRKINHTGSRSMISEMDDLHLYLRSKNLLNQLSNKEWDKFEALLLPVEQQLDILDKVAREYQEENVTGISCKIDEKAEALKLLGFNPNTPIESIGFQVIRESYKKLAREYHPDKAEQTTTGIRGLAEEKFKKINWAYQTLTKYKGCSNG